MHQITIPRAFNGWTPRAVAFDCDGTLVDTEPCWTRAQAELFAARGLAFTPAHELALYGLALTPRCTRIAEIFGDRDSGPDIRDELLYLVTERISAHAVPRPGARQAAALVTAAVPAAVVSNAPQSLLDIALKRAGLDGMFPVIIAAEAASRPKPAPDPYLLGCARLGTSPNATLAIEDSATGLRSARRAGLATLAVPSIPGQPLRADAVISTLEHPSLTRWIGTWPRRSPDAQPRSDAGRLQPPGAPADGSEAPSRTNSRCAAPARRPTLELVCGRNAGMRAMGRRGTMKEIAVAVLADDPLTREGAAACLSAHPGEEPVLRGAGRPRA